MPDNNNQPLPPLEEEAFKHGEKYSAEVKPKACPHNNIEIISSLEIKCPTCQAGWTGVGVMSLYNAIRAQVK